MQNSATFEPSLQTEKSNLSRRFLTYQKDKSKRGRSLALANVLENLKKNPEYADFSPHLIEAISRIRESGRETEESRATKIVQVLKEFPSTIEEITEDTGITRKEVILIVRSLVLQKVVIEKQQPHYLAAGDHYTPFYELVPVKC